MSLKKPSEEHTLLAVAGRCRYSLLGLSNALLHLRLSAKASLTFTKRSSWVNVRSYWILSFRCSFWSLFTLLHRPLECDRRSCQYSNSFLARRQAGDHLCRPVLNFRQCSSALSIHAHNSTSRSLYSSAKCGGRGWTVLACKVFICWYMSASSMAWWRCSRYFFTTLGSFSFNLRVRVWGYIASE